MLPADHDRATEYQETSRRIRTSDQATAAKELADLAGEVRRTIVSMIDRAGMGHVGGDLSVTDILVTCFWGALNLDPANPTWPGRDRFILSKGHCAAALYSTLARCGFFEASRAGHLHAAPVGAQRPPQPEQGARDRDQHRRPRPRAAGGGRLRLRRPIGTSNLAHVRGPRRRRDAGRQQLGGGDDGRPLPAVLT